MINQSNHSQRVKIATRIILWGMFAWLAWIYSGYLSNYLYPQAREPEFTVDIAALAAGDYMIVRWDRRKLYVWHRTQNMLRTLSGYEDQLTDPNSSHSIQPREASNAYRSVNPYYLVVFAQGEGEDCEVEVVSEASTDIPVTSWFGGFRDVCRGSYYDLAGRSYRNHDAPRNLEVPQHQIVGRHLLLMGEE